MKFIVGNWKMNGNIADKEALLKSLKTVKTGNNIVICLPFTLLSGNNHSIIIGAQDISEHDNGAYTGDISAKMVKDAGAKYVLVGHSERRFYHKETNAMVKAKAVIAIQNKLIPIICIGETATERKSGRTMSVIKKMLLESIPDKGKFIVAYEPRWAIGSDITPTKNEIESVFRTITKILLDIKRKNIALLYGGGVQASNAHDIVSIPNVDGLLVGGASLKSNKFLPIIKSIEK